MIQPLLEFASDFLRSSSTGVDRLEVMKSEISREQLPNFVGEQRALQLVEEAESGRRRFIRAPIAGDAWIEVADVLNYGFFSTTSLKMNWARLLTVASWKAYCVKSCVDTTNGDCCRISLTDNQ